MPGAPVRSELYRAVDDEDWDAIHNGVGAAAAMAVERSLGQGESAMACGAGEIGHDGWVEGDGLACLERHRLGY